jgi:hypothetical protein
MVLEGDVAIKRLSDDITALRLRSESFSGRASETQAQLDVMWEKLFELQEQVSGIVRGSRARLSTRVWPGDQIYFGDYHGKRLRWKVLSSKRDCALIIADECLEPRPCRRKGLHGGWESSPMREWLNTVFLSHLDGEVIAVRLSNKALQADETHEPIEDEPDTVDKVFLLSHEEALEHFSAEESRIACLRGVPCWWWLRTRGALRNTQAFVLDCGKLVGLGALASSDLCCPRPACWVSLDSIEDVDRH